MLDNHVIVQGAMVAAFIFQVGIGVYALKEMEKFDKDQKK